MPRPKSSIGGNDGPVSKGATDAETWRKLPQDVRDRLAIAHELPDEIRERLRCETGFPDDGFEELQTWLVLANVARPLEEIPTLERRLPVFKRVKRQAEQFLRKGSGGEPLRQSVEALHVGFFGDIFRQGGFNFDGLLVYLEGSEIDGGELHLLHFIDFLTDAIDTIIAKNRGQGRPWGLTLNASISHLRAIFRSRCESPAQERSRRGFIEVLSPYEERELAFVAIVLGQCRPVPNSFYVSDDGKHRNKEWRNALLRLFRKASCHPRRSTVGRSTWRPGDSSHWPSEGDQLAPPYSSTG